MITWTGNETRTAPVSGIVTGRNGVLYTITTASGRVLGAQSTAVYTIGDPVVVLAGQILGRSGRPQPSKIYEV
jgi:hypothetical protein